MKDGGPAFPQPKQGNPNTAYMDAGPGMTLRDWFAGQALGGWYSGDSVLQHEASMPVCAKHFYQMADAMLKSREESNG